MNDNIMRLEARIKELEKERDQMAAHVKRYRSAYVKLTNTSVVNDYWERLLPPSLLDEFDRIDEDSPSTSLTRRDARMKAEALEEVSNKLHDAHYANEEVGYADAGEQLLVASDIASEMASRYRKKAEG